MPTDAFGTPTVLADQAITCQGIAPAGTFGPAILTQEIFLVTSPSVAEPPAAREYLFKRVDIPRGITVYVIDGVYTQIRQPPDDLVADEIYFGGREYEVSQAKATELEAQGFTTRTVIR